MLRQALKGCDQVVEGISPSSGFLRNENRTIFSKVIDKNVKSDLDVWVKKRGVLLLEVGFYCRGRFHRPVAFYGMKIGPFLAKLLIKR